MALHEEAVRAAADREDPPHLVGIGLRLEGVAQHDHVDRDLAILADQGVLTADDEVRALTVEANKVAPQFDGPGDVTVFCPGVADLMTGDALALYPGLPSIEGASSFDDADR